MEWDWPNIVFITSPGHENSAVWLPLLIAAIGAVFGGLITFLTTFYFYRRERRQQKLDLSYAFYVSLMTVINDVFSVSSRYFESLGDLKWPIEPWTRMPELLGDANVRVEVAPELLSTISGPHAKGLVNDVLELVSFRNQIVAASSEFSIRKSALFAKTAHRTELGRGLWTSMELDPKKDQALIMEVRSLDSLAKQLLDMTLRFGDRQADIAARYNHFTANHSIKEVQGFKAEFVYLRPWQVALPQASS